MCHKWASWYDVVPTNDELWSVGKGQAGVAILPESSWSKLGDDIASCNLQRPTAQDYYVVMSYLKQWMSWNSEPLPTQQRKIDHAQAAHHNAASLLRWCACEWQPGQQADPESRWDGTATALLIVAFIPPHSSHISYDSRGNPLDLRLSIGNGTMSHYFSGLYLDHGNEYSLTSCAPSKVRTSQWPTRIDTTWMSHSRSRAWAHVCAYRYVNRP